MKIESRSENQSNRRINDKEEEIESTIDVVTSDGNKET